MKLKFLPFILSMCLLLTIQAQNTIHVPGDQPSIQAGINAAMDGDVVLVDQGTYYENIDFKGKAITVKSYFDPESPDSSIIFNTIIDGSQSADPDSASVVYFINEEDTTSIISGFTISGGTGTKVYSDLFGGGIICYSAGAKIIHNMIVDNHLSDSAGGGWAYISGGGIGAIDNQLKHYLVIRHNIIKNNSCSRYENGFAGTTGGGISGTGYKECFIEGNYINNNVALTDIESLYSLGGGIELEYVKGFVDNNYISDNEIFSNSVQTYSWGVGVYCYNFREGSIISNNTIQGNTSEALYCKGGGLGIGSCQDNVIIDGNLILNNTALRGGGIALGGTTGVTTHITNNVIRGNYAQMRNGGLRIQGSFKDNHEFSKNKKGIITDERGDNAISSGAIVLANNTFYENTEFNKLSGGAEVMVTSNNVPLVAFNNIFYNTSESVYVIRLEDGSMSYFYNNILDEDRLYHTINSQWEGDNNFYENPLLMEDSIHLSDDSPCIDVGANSLEVNGGVYYCPEKDFDNGLRPECGTADIGADELVCVRIPIHGKKEGIEIIAYPNPMSSHADIRYSLSNIQYAKLSIYDSFGRLIEILQDGVQQKGEYTVTWNAEEQPPGIYLLRTIIGNQEYTAKIIKR